MSKAAHDLPDDLKQIAKAFGNLLTCINALLKFARAFNAMKGEGRCTVTITEGNVVIDVKSDIPAGFGPEEFTICDSGSPATRNFITDNPD